MAILFFCAGNIPISPAGRFPNSSFQYSWKQQECVEGSRPAFKAGICQRSVACTYTAPTHASVTIFTSTCNWLHREALAYTALHSYVQAAACTYCDWRLPGTSANRLHLFPLHPRLLLYIVCTAYAPHGNFLVWQSVKMAVKWKKVCVRAEAIWAFNSRVRSSLIQRVLLLSVHIHCLVWTRHCSFTHLHGLQMHTTNST